MKKKLYYILPIIIVLIVILVIVTIKCYHVYNTNKQKEFVINYLNSEYPNYDFEIIETEKSCWPYTPFDCEDIYVNEVLLKSHNIKFEVQVTRPKLSVYYDEFEDIYAEIK